MSHLIPNSFSTFSLNEDEELQGSILTINQKEVIQNQLAIHAEEKLAIEFDTNKPNEFSQQEAYKRGCIDTLRYLLDNSTICEETLQERRLDNNQ